MHHLSGMHQETALNKNPPEHQAARWEFIVATQSPHPTVAVKATVLNSVAGWRAHLWWATLDAT